MNTKNLKISQETHTKIKTYCAENQYMLSSWLDDLIILNLKYPILIKLLEMTSYISRLYKARGEQDEKYHKALDNEIEKLKNWKAAHCKSHGILI